MIYLTWAMYAGGLAYLGWRGQWVLALFWLAGVPLFEWLYIRKFPSLSRSWATAPSWTKALKPRGMRP